MPSLAAYCRSAGGIAVNMAESGARVSIYFSDPPPSASKVVVKIVETQDKTDKGADRELLRFVGHITNKTFAVESSSATPYPTPDPVRRPKISQLMPITRARPSVHERPPRRQTRPRVGSSVPSLQSLDLRHSLGQDDETRMHAPRDGLGCPRTDPGGVLDEARRAGACPESARTGSPCRDHAEGRRASHACRGVAHCLAEAGTRRCMAGLHRAHAGGSRWGKLRAWLYSLRSVPDWGSGIGT